MKGETKLFLGFVAAILVIVGAAVFFFSSPAGQSATPAADRTLLVRSDSEKISSPSARATLVEFADYQCPACGAYYPVVKQVVSEFTGKLNFVFRNFPLDQHPNAKPAAYAAEAAGRQGKFWQMHDLIYTNQVKWSDSPDAAAIFEGYAKTLGLNMDHYKKDVASQAVSAMIDRDVSDATALGVDATPTFYLNGVKLDNPAAIDDFRTAVKKALETAVKKTSG
ncbi:DsbA family protein [Patescibacteria group bacterium]|nr:DsbA family protein [Patescibacteria group bacterium]